MNIFFTITAIAFFVWVGRNILFWVALWQDKEYRFDRLQVHVKETLQGQQLLSSFGNIAKWILFLLFFYVVFHDNLTSWYEKIIGAFYVGQGIYIARDVVLHRIKRPVFTAKAISLCVLSFLMVACLFFLALLDQFVWVLVVDRCVPLVVALFVFFLAFPTEIYRDIQMQRAKKKLKKYKNLRVIAVSGSYGKTSTKEYIAQILSKKFEVVKTVGSNNTPIAIAQTILKKITHATEIFVVEMGAYKIGEIEEICSIVKPQISVTTAISDQHLSLYGNMENVVFSEYELIHALPKDGLALFNGNNKNTHILFNRTKKKKVYYEWFEKEPKKKISIGAYDVIPTLYGTQFTIICNGEEFVCKTPLLGIHVIENILPAIFLGRHFGITKADIIKGVAGLLPPMKTLNRITLENKSIGIDDTFNASPESVLSALDYISLYKTQKICVLGPLTELGKFAKERHKEIGERIAQVCDFVFVLNKNYYEQLQEGVVRARGTCILQVGRADDIAAQIRKISKEGDVILFEGKESGMVLKKLI